MININAQTWVCIFTIFRYLVITFTVKRCPVWQIIHQIFSVIQTNWVTEYKQDKQVDDHWMLESTQNYF
jgi:hypothetical protein